MERSNMSPQEIQGELDAYEESIAYLDYHLSLLMDKLERRGVLKNTLVMITADHGEQFGEHGFFTHGNSLYLSTLHVPLLILFPARVPKGLRIHQPVSLHDTASTVVDLIGLVDQAYFPGNSLARYWDRTRDSRSFPVDVLLSELTSSDSATPPSQWKGARKSLVIDRYHYIKNGDGREELYDFDNDPWEKRNLANLEEGHELLLEFRTHLEAMAV
jgi:arylsulfatase A-like enzyme